MNKQILLITANFPPEDQVGVYRGYRLARYLPRLGWKVHILTVDVNYVYREDPSLIDALPPEVEVHRARYIEPTLRGVRMALGGADSTEAALSQRAKASTPVGGVREPRSQPAARRVAERVRGWVLKQWLANPDNVATWYRPALRMARRLVRELDIPLVMTTEPDFTGHRIGAQLQKEGAAWVADIRDPTVYLMRLGTSRTDKRLYRHRHEIEQYAVTHANAVTVASQGIGMILADSYGAANISNLEFIPTGFDPEVLSNGPKTQFPDPPYLLYPGRVFPEYGSHFLEIFAAALQRDGVRKTGINLIIVGDRHQNAPLIEPVARRLGILDHVKVIDRVPQGTIARWIDGALAGVIMTGRLSFWWCLYSKAGEYMALRKPVVALLPELSETRMHLERTGLGVFLDRDLEADADTLAAFILGRATPLEVDTGECDRFLASSQAAAFASLFDRLLESR